MLKGKVLVAQGGGPTAVINQSMVGVVQEARRIPSVERVYGALHGVRGIVDENFVDLTQETDLNLEMIAATPSSALGSTRDKPDLEYCKNIFKVCQAHDIQSFFYCGGNDSSDTCRIVAEEAEASGYPLRCVHVPKTIDNDLVINDHTPGFPSAARYVASAFAGLNLDNAALPGVFLGVVMGRHAGFMTGAAAALRQNEADGPHLVYVPERTFDMDAFITDVKAVYDKYGRCIIAVSEGVHDASGAPIITQLMQEVEKDAHGNVQLSGTGALGDLLADAVKDRTGIKRVRADTLGYMQRSFLGCVSDVDQREAREVGQKAVNFAHYRDSSGTVTIRRVGEYRVEYELDKLSDVAAKTKTMADEFINAEANNVTKAFVDYVTPLLGSGIPETARVRLGNRVDKILG